jgi:hypothetical protein
MRQCRRLRWKLQIWNLPLPLALRPTPGPSPSACLFRNCDSRRRGPGCTSNDSDRPEAELAARWSRLVPPSAAPCRHDPGRQFESSRSRQLERHAAVNAGSKLVASRRGRALGDLIRASEQSSRGGWTVKSGGRLSSWAPPSEVGLTSIALVYHSPRRVLQASGSHHLPTGELVWKAGSGCQCNDDHDAGSAAQIGVWLTVTGPRYFFAPGAVARRSGPRLVVCQWISQ